MEKNLNKAMKKEDIFRQESVDQISTPDDLKQYIKFASPGMWLTMIAILIFMVGGCVWCIFAKLDTKVISAVLVENDVATCFVSEDDPVKPGMYIEIEGQKYTLHEHSEKLVKLQVTDESDDVILHTMDKDEDGWYNIYLIPGFSSMNNGIHRGEIIIDSVSPISFLTNGN